MFLKLLWCNAICALVLRLFHSMGSVLKLHFGSGSLALAVNIADNADWAPGALSAD